MDRRIDQNEVEAQGRFTGWLLMAIFLLGMVGFTTLGRYFGSASGELSEEEVWIMILAAVGLGVACWLPARKLGLLYKARKEAVEQGLLCRNPHCRKPTEGLERCSACDTQVFSCDESQSLNQKCKRFGHLKHSRESLYVLSFWAVAAIAAAVSIENGGSRLAGPLTLGLGFLGFEIVRNARNLAEFHQLKELTNKLAKAGELCKKCLFLYPEGPECPSCKKQVAAWKKRRRRRGRGRV